MLCVAVVLLRAQDEIHHLYGLSRVTGLAFLTRHLDSLRDLSFLLALIINVLVLLAYGVQIPTSQLQPSDPGMLKYSSQTFIGNAPLGYSGVGSAIRILGILQTLLSGFVLYLFLCKFGKVIQKRGLGRLAILVARHESTLRAGKRTKSLAKSAMFLAIKALGWYPVLERYTASRLRNAATLPKAEASLLTYSEEELRTKVVASRAPSTVLE